MLGPLTAFLLFATQVGSTVPGQLVITNARVLDVRTGAVAPRRTVLIENGIIGRVVSDSQARALRLSAVETLNARGRLLTPGFIDAHFHTSFLLGDTPTGTGGFLTHLSRHPDSVRAYRRRVAEAYLPYGVTLVRDAGSAVEDFHLLRALMARGPDAPDFLPGRRAARFS